MNHQEDLELLSFIEQQNPWWEEVEVIEKDEKIEIWKKQPLAWNPRILEQKFTKPGVWIISGPRQVGKTTALKLLIRSLLRKKKPPETICYLRADLIKDYKQLYLLLNTYSGFSSSFKTRYLFIDEINFVDEWPRAIKSLIDEAKLNKDIIILTGSASWQIKGETELLPGRRGEGKDIFFSPLSFSEIIELLKINHQEKPSLLIKKKPRLIKEFKNYLLTGGFIKVINEFYKTGKISDETYNLYWSWLKGDILKFERSENLFLEIMQKLTDSLGGVLSYHNIASQTSIGSHLTVFDYLQIARKLFIIEVLPNLNLNTKLPAWRKTKKPIFTDPFLFWTIYSRLQGGERVFNLTKQKLPLFLSILIEGSVIANLIPFFPRWGFWRNKTEIDFVGIKKGKMYGVEIGSGKKKPISPPAQIHHFFTVSENELPSWLFLTNPKYWLFGK